jgi:hypothetical protein
MLAAWYTPPSAAEAIAAAAPAPSAPAPAPPHGPAPSHIPAMDLPPPPAAAPAAVPAAAPPAAPPAVAPGRPAVVAPSVRAAAVLKLIAEFGSPASDVFSGVGLAQIEECVAAAAHHFGVRAEGAAWSVDVVVAQVCRRVSQAVACHPVAVLDMFAQLQGVTSPAARCMSVLVDLPHGERAANTPLSQQQASQGAADGVDDVLSTVVSRLGAHSAATTAIASLSEEAASAQGAEQGLLLLAHANAAERNAEYGADLAFIMRQENLAVLPPGARALSATANLAWRQLRSLRLRVHHIRTLAFTELLPIGVAADKAVAAAECGAVCVDALVGGAAKAKRGDALLLAWPAFVELADDVAPLDTGARRALIQLARLAFATSTTHGESLVTRVFQRYAALFASYRGGFEKAAPLWREVIDDAMQKAGEEAAAASLSRGGGADAGAPADSPAVTAAKAKKHTDGQAAGEARKALKAAQEALTAAPGDAAKKAAVEAAERRVETAAAAANAASAALKALTKA